MLSFALLASIRQQPSATAPPPSPSPPFPYPPASTNLSAYLLQSVWAINGNDLSSCSGWGTVPLSGNAVDCLALCLACSGCVGWSWPNCNLKSTVSVAAGSANPSYDTYYVSLNNCPAGTYSTKGGSASTCQPCPVDTYQPSVGASFCYPCGVDTVYLSGYDRGGTTNGGTGQTSCLCRVSCSDGVLRLSFRLSHCKLIFLLLQAGWFSLLSSGYLDSINQYRCSICPAGTYSTSVGGIGYASCTRCSTGYTTSSSGAATSSSACSVPICPTGYVNMALGKLTNSSSIDNGGGPTSIAIDDTLATGNFETHAVNASFYVDLGTSNSLVSSVYIWQRTDCEQIPSTVLCSSRLQNLDVRVGTNNYQANWQANTLCNYQAVTWTGVFGVNLTCSSPLGGPSVTIQGTEKTMCDLVYPLTKFPDMQSLLVPVSSSQCWR